MNRLRQTIEVLGDDANDAVTRCIDVRNQHEGDGDDERQDDEHTVPALVLWEPKPSNKLQQMAIAAMRPHAAVGIRFQ
jgi:hypothetical protein